MSKESINIRIARIQDKINKSMDNLERAVLVEELEKLQKEVKESKKKTNTKLNTISEAPSIMDRKKSYVPFNGHNFDPKSVNGVFENTSTIVQI